MLEAETGTTGGVNFDGARYPEGIRIGAFCGTGRSGGARGLRESAAIAIAAIISLTITSHPLAWTADLNHESDVRNKVGPTLTNI